MNFTLSNFPFPLAHLYSFFVIAGLLMLCSISWFWSPPSMSMETSMHPNRNYWHLMKTKLWIETPNKPPNNKCWNPAMTRNRIRIRNGCVWIRSEETKALWCRQDKTAGVFPIAIIAARLDWIYHVARNGGEGYRYHPICWVRRPGHWTSLGCGIHPPLGWN